MKEQNGKINEKPDLSPKRQALLDWWLQGKIPVDLKAKSIPKRKVFSPVPLSFAQKRLWVLDRLVPGNAFYNFPTALRLQGAIDLPVFERSINELVRRHESLRTIFKMENEEPVQVILPELQIKINIIDLSHLPAAERENETNRITIEETGQPFNLEQGPLLRVSLLTLAADAHILIYTMHHIVTDGWSIDLFKREWGIIYEAFLANQPSPLPELSVQYADFALWQREWFQGGPLQKQLSYWKNILSGDIPILEMPADRQRPAISSYRGEKLSIAIPGSLAAPLSHLTRKAGCTMFMTILAAFSVLLYRYCGQDDIMIGTSLASRTKPELEEIIGFFANTIVIRCNLAGSPTFRQLLERIRRITADAYDNQDLPFEKLVEELQPDRYMNHNPLFQAMAVLENVTTPTTPTAAVKNEHINISPVPADSGTAKFDLWLLIVQSEKSIVCTLEYSTDLFDSDRIARLLRHYKNLLEAAVADPDGPIDSLSILTKEEQQQLLFQWNDTQTRFQYLCLHHAYENQVEKTPTQIALVGSSINDIQGEISRLNYAELNERAGHVAALLKEKGVAPDTIVAIMIERSIEMVIGLMGILKAGGAYLPIDPELPQDRIDYMLKDSGARILLKKPEIRNPKSRYFQTNPNASNSNEQTKRAGVTVLDFEHLNFEFVSNFEIRASDLNLSNLAYIIYTSGSTGKPKGVMINHEGISNRLHWMQEEYGLARDDRVLQKTPFSFDVSVWEFFWTLSTGAALVMALPGGHKDSAYLVEIINREQITTMHFVPTMLNVFLEDPAIPTIRSLKRVICSGEALPLEYQERFFKHFAPPVELHNLYGPTEASVDVTAWPCQRNPHRHMVPIGRPIANTQIYILDKKLNPVPIGVHGELYIGGIQLARGYLNNPELTAEKFIEIDLNFNRSYRSDMSYQNYIKLYKTGDLARWLPDGVIEFLGRLDSQVKVRGFRIELGEIESNLREFESVSDAAVLVTGDSPDAKTKKLIAYIVPDMNYWKSYRQEDAIKGDLSLDQVATWQHVFDDAYTKNPGPQDPTFNIAGWNSSYTGAPIPAEEMRTWVDNTVERILAFKPRRVMEIGCGTGLFLFRLINHCRMFIGTDISRQGLNYIESRLKEMKEPGKAEVLTMHRGADNFDGIEPADLDMIFLNSVIQYFPTADYLVEVLTKAAEKIKPGGHIFIGDVRSLPLLELFHTSVELSKAEPGVDKETIRRRVFNKISLEQELLVDPLFFDAIKKRIPRIKHVQRLIKYGRYTNELSKFRYDVILHIEAEDQDQPLIPPQLVLDWKKEKPAVGEIKDLLSGLAKQGQGHEPECIMITSVPNARITQDILDMKRLSSTGDNGSTAGIEPDDFLELGKEFPYDISVHVSLLPGEEACFDVILTRRNLNTKIPGAWVQDMDIHHWHPHGELPEAKSYTYTNNPLLVKISGSLIPRLRDHLKEKLPEYMVPSHFVLLDRLPITSNGKLDRRALPEPTLMPMDPNKEFTEPATELEIGLARLWREVLNLEKVSVNHNFFELGGDSVNAIQVVSRANKVGVKITVQMLFLNQTIAELAIAVEKDSPKTVINWEDSCKEFMKSLDMAAILEQLPAGVEIEDIYPASPLQLHQATVLENRAVDAPSIFLFQTCLPPWNITLDVDIFDKALQTVSERYSMLRTILIWKNLPEPVQVVCKKLKADFVYSDISAVPPEKKDMAVIELLKQDWNNGFDRIRSSPMRIGVIKLDANHIRLFITGDFVRMDGWSSSEFTPEIISFYMAFTAGSTIPPRALQANCFKEYMHTMRILRKQTENPAEAYWRSVFKDFSPMKSLTSIPGNQTGQGTGFGFNHFFLSPELSTRMEQFVMEHQSSISHFTQGIWALLLGHYLQEDRVVYGMVTAGRSIPLANIEYMTGHSINILPMAVPISKKKPFLDYLKDIRDIQTEWTRYEYTQVEQVYEWLDLQGDYPLFDHYIVIQNLDSAKGNIRGMERNDDIGKQGEKLLFLKMDYLLRIDIYPGYDYCFTFNYYLHSLTTPALKGLMDNLKTLIENIIATPDQTIEELTKSVDTGKYKLYENESPDGFVQQ